MAAGLAAQPLVLAPLDGLLSQYSASITAAGANNEGSAQEFDLLHQIMDAVQTMPRPALQALGKQLQDTMLAAMQQGPTAPFRRLIAGVLKAYYTYGDGRPPYSIVTFTQQWLNNKPANNPHPNGRACAILVLGAMTEISGRQLLSLLEETISIINKYLKTDYPAGVRHACMKALRDVIEGSGKQAAHLHLEIMKHIKTAHTDKAAEVREAAAACVLALARLDVARERLVNVCMKGLEDGVPAVRAAFAEALGAMLARALLAPDKKMDDDEEEAAAAAAQAAGRGAGTSPQPAAERLARSAKEPSLPTLFKKKRFISGGGVDGVVAYLTIPFCAGGAAREVRAGVAIAWGYILREVRRVDGERRVPEFALLSLRLLHSPKAFEAPGEAAHARACVEHVLHAAWADEAASERARAALAAQYGATLQAAGALSARGDPGGNDLVLVALASELAGVVESLGEAAAGEAREKAAAAAQELLEHPAPSVRLAAAAVARATGAAVPGRLSVMVNVALNQLKLAHVEMASGVNSRPQLLAHVAAMHGASHALAGLLAGLPKCPLGIPYSLTSGALDCALNLLGQQYGASAEPAVTQARSEAGWAVLTAVAPLGADWLGPAHLKALYGALSAVLAPPPDEPRTKAEVARDLRARLSALGALRAYVAHALAPRRREEAAGEGEEAAPEEGEDLAAAGSFPAEETRAVLALLINTTGYMSGIRETGVTRDPAAAVVKGLEERVRGRALEVFALLPLAAFEVSASGSGGTGASAVGPLVQRCIEELSSEATSAPSIHLLRRLVGPADAVVGPWPPPGHPLDAEERLYFAGQAAVELEPDFLFARSARAARLQAAWAPQELCDASLRLFARLYPLLQVDAQEQAVDTLLAPIRRKGNATLPLPTIASIGAAGLAALSAGAPPSRAGEGEAVTPRQPPSFKLFASFQELFLAVAAEAGREGPYPLRRLAAVGLAELARVAGNEWVGNLLGAVAEQAPRKDAAPRGALALAIGTIHRAVGGAKCLPHLPLAVSALHMMARDPAPGVHVCALHALALVVDSAGPSFAPHARETVAVALQASAAEAYGHPAAQRALAALAAALLPVVGPELGTAPDSPRLRPFLVLLAELRASGDVAVQEETARCLQVLTDLAPAAVPAAGSPALAALVQHLRSGMLVPSGRTRRVVARCLAHVARRAPEAACAARFEEHLFMMVDCETDPAAARVARAALLSLCRIRTATPAGAAAWAALCGRVLLGTAGAGAGGPAGAGPPAGGLASKGEREGGGGGEEDDDEAGEERYADREGGGDGSAPQPAGGSTGPAAGRVSSGPLPTPSPVPLAGGGEQTPAEAAVTGWTPGWRAKAAAVEALRALLRACAGTAAHFDILLARQERARDPEAGAGLLIFHLADLLKCAFGAASSPVPALQPLGLALMLDLLQRFGEVPDPEYEGHVLMEQYSAQVVAALRPALAREAAPGTQSAACALAAAFLCSPVLSPRRADVAPDAVLVKRVLALLTGPLEHLRKLRFDEYGEEAACGVQLALLAALARVHVASRAAAAALGPALPALRHHWLDLLRDFSLTLAPAPAAPAPFALYDAPPAAAAAVGPVYRAAFAPALRALAALLHTPLWGAPAPRPPPAAHRHQAAPAPHADKADPTREMHLMLGLCAAVLAGGAAPAPPGSAQAAAPPSVEPTAEEAAACIGALARLLRPDAALGAAVTPAMLAELLRVSLCAARAAAASAAVEGAAAELALALASHCPRERYFSGGPEAAAATHALFELAALPLHRHLPAAAAAASEPAALSPAQSAAAAAALAALAAFAVRLLGPGLAAGPAGPAAPYAPAALLLLTRALARCPADLAPEALKALRAAAGAGGALAGHGAGEAAGRWWLELLAATASALIAALDAVGMEGTAAAQRRQALLSGLATLLPALPVDGPPAACPAAHAAALVALRAALASPNRQVAGQAVAAVRAIANGPAAAAGRAYVGALGPDLAACLLRPDPGETAGAGSIAVGLAPWEGAGDSTGAVRLEAVRVLLRAVALTPDDARGALVAALVPAVVGSLQGPAALQRGALEGLTQLAGAAPDAFRAAAAALAPDARRRMEEAVRASVAQAAPQAAPEAAAPAARASAGAGPKIQLRMDFSNFGKK